MSLLRKLNLTPSQGRTVGQQMSYEVRKAVDSAATGMRRPVMPWLTRRWDQRRDHAMKVTDGAHALTGRAAIFLLFQPSGLRPSTIATLRGLVEAGLSPVVVSNARLGSADRAALAAGAAVVLERPNLGYDFGGYRDALHWLRSQSAPLEEVLFLNDSFWFRDVDGTLALSQILSATGALVGYSGHTDPENRVTSLESHFFLLRQPLLDDPRCRAFWDGMILHPTKQDVVTHCERPLAATLDPEGRDTTVVFSIQRNLRHMETLGGPAEPAVMGRLFVIGIRRNERVALARREFAERRIDRDAFNARITAELAATTVSEAFVALALRDLEFGLIKKKFFGRPGPLRDQLLNILDRDRIAMASEVLDELRA